MDKHEIFAARDTLFLDASRRRLIRAPIVLYYQVGCGVHYKVDYNVDCGVDCRVYSNYLIKLHIYIYVAN